MAFPPGTSGYLSVEHKEDGSHSAVTADSVTTTGDISVGGDLEVDGDANVDGTVTADADGHPVSIGPVNSGAGLDMSQESPTASFSSHWQIFARVSAAGRSLFFRDALEATIDYIFGIARTTTGSGAVKYSLTPNTTVSLSLGEDVNNLRIEEVNAKTLRSHGGLYERGRTAAAGDWTGVPFNAGDYTGDAAGSAWTVTAANVTTLRWRISGHSLLVSYVISGTNVSGSPVNLRLVIPGGYTAAATMTNSCARCLDAGALVPARVAVTAGGTSINLARTDLAPWTNTAGSNTTLQGQIEFEVQ